MISETFNDTKKRHQQTTSSRVEYKARQITEAPKTVGANVEPRLVVKLLCKYCRPEADMA